MCNQLHVASPLLNRVAIDLVLDTSINRCLNLFLCQLHMTMSHISVMNPMSKNVQSATHGVSKGYIK